MFSELLGLNTAGKIYIGCAGWAARNLALHATIPLLKAFDVIDIPWGWAFIFSYLHLSVLAFFVFVVAAFSAAYTIKATEDE